MFVAAPRLPLRSGGSWGDTVLDFLRARWNNVLDRRRGRKADSVRMADLSQRFPVALLVQ